MKMGRLSNKLYYDFKLNETHYDFLGYYFDDKKELSYHHIQPKQYGGKTTYENGALLGRKTSHDYIHLIEDMDFKLFLELSQILKDEHAAKSITREHLIEIRRLLEFFETKYDRQYTKRGNLIIKEDFIRRRIILWTTFTNL